MPPKYNWKNYGSLVEGNSLFAQRNHNLQSASVDAASSLQEELMEGLEFGVGIGNTARYFLGRIPSLNLTSLDIDLEAVQIAREELENFESRITIEQEDFLKYKIGEKFDLVYGVLVVHNYPDKAKIEFFEKAYKLLKPKGIFILGDIITSGNNKENKRCWEEDYKMIEELNPEDYEFWKNHFDEIDTNFASPLGWHLRQLKKIGFDNVELTYGDKLWKVLRMTRQTN